VGVGREAIVWVADGGRGLLIRRSWRGHGRGFRRVGGVIGVDEGYRRR